jgi:integration host factor subunit beta
MVRSELVLRVAARFGDLQAREIERVVARVFGEIASALIRGDRVELRGFGTLTLREHSARIGRNPATGAPVNVPAKYFTNFKPGKQIQDRLNRPA